MEFSTKVPIAKAENPISYDSEVVLLGSCFATNIADKLAYFQFKKTVNPFGILFSPCAVEKAISFAVNQKKFGEDDVFFHRERWHSFDAHSEMSGSQTELLANLNEAATHLRDSLSAATHIIITLGTAWVYRHKATGELVANCHKVAQKEFAKELLSVTEVETALRNMVSHLHSCNAKAQVIFTVSPVRHIKDGFIENQRSKAHLFSGLHQVLQIPVISHPPPVIYFPAYEILMDELRDYRFYAADMLHPSPIALSYIWERFVESCVDPAAVPVMKSVASIRQGLQHRPFDPEGEAYRNHRAKLEANREALEKIYPHFEFDGP